MVYELMSLRVDGFASFNLMLANLGFIYRKLVGGCGHELATSLEKVN